MSEPAPTGKVPAGQVRVTVFVCNGATVVTILRFLITSLSGRVTPSGMAPTGRGLEQTTMTVTVIGCPLVLS
jgi:hypothetical protein